MKNLKTLLILMVVGLLLGLIPMQTWAQDATDVTAVPQPGATVEQPETTNQENDFLSLTLGEALAILVATASLFVGFGKILWDANQNPGGASVDARVTTRIQESQSDRTYMDALEKAYTAGNAAQQKAIESLVGILKIIAPQTPLRLDDAALEFLRDMQTLGAPPRGASTPGVEVNVNPAPAVPRYEAQTPVPPQTPLPDTPPAG